jgi:P27 family predicted phage terminase small subunit
MKGRKPIPNEIKQLNGTLRPCRDKSPNLKPSIEVGLQAPEDLNEWGQKLWTEIFTEYGNIGLITRVDLGSFHSLCSWYGIFREAEDIVRFKGLEVEEEIYNKDGQVVGSKTVTNPMIMVMDKAQKNYLAMAREFGVTPSSRAGLTFEAKEKKDDFNDFD